MQASFAKVENGVVTRIAVVAREFLENNPERYGDASLWVPMEWGVKGKHGAEGYLYDVQKELFYASQPYPSWTLDENNDWNPPTPYPSDNESYEWNETALDWVEV
jgi:hypothetical protein